MKLTEQKLRKIIKEEIKSLDEKVQHFPKYVSGSLFDNKGVVIKYSGKKYKVFFEESADTQSDDAGCTAYFATEDSITFYMTYCGEHKTDWDRWLEVH